MKSSHGKLTCIWVTLSFNKVWKRPRTEKKAQQDIRRQGSNLFPSKAEKNLFLSPSLLIPSRYLLWANFPLYRPFFLSYLSAKGKDYFLRQQLYVFEAYQGSLARLLPRDLPGRKTCKLIIHRENTSHWEAACGGNYFGVWLPGFSPHSFW